MREYTHFILEIESVQYKFYLGVTFNTTQKDVYLPHSFLFVRQKLSLVSRLQIIVFWRYILTVSITPTQFEGLSDTDHPNHSIISSISHSTCQQIFTSWLRSTRLGPVSDSLNHRCRWSISKNAHRVGLSLRLVS